MYPFSYCFTLPFCAFISPIVIFYCFGLYDTLSLALRNELLPRFLWHLAHLPKPLYGSLLCEHHPSVVESMAQNRNSLGALLMLLRVHRNFEIEPGCTNDFHRDDIDDFGRTSVDPTALAQLRYLIHAAGKNGYINYRSSDSSMNPSTLRWPHELINIRVTTHNSKLLHQLT
ncbi:hypothetical protein F4604DRAFT_1711930 [Suillus subluteus]|nr:hypothetical protein F4604DRAFT_1711930 [Suillus subluteus]